MNVSIAERNRIVVANLPLVWFLVKKRRVPPHLCEDASQAGAMGLLRAVELYEPERHPGVPLSAYGALWINSAINVVLKRASKHPDHVELDEAMLFFDPRDRAELATEIHNLRGYIAELPVRQMQILAARMRGETSNAIGKTMRVSGQRIRQLEAQAYEGIRELARRRRRALADATRMSA